MATTVDDGTEQISAWLRANVGGKVVRINRQPRWRPVWFADVERDGELLELCVRGDRTDMPLIFPAFVKALAMHTAPAAMYYPDGHLGVPALLDRQLIDMAAQLSGDKGLGPLLQGANALPGESLLRDVDTPEDLAAVERFLTIRSLGHGPGSPFPL